MCARVRFHFVCLYSFIHDLPLCDHCTEKKKSSSISISVITDVQGTSLNLSVGNLAGLFYILYIICPGDGHRLGVPLYMIVLLTGYLWPTCVDKFHFMVH